MKKLLSITMGIAIFWPVMCFAEGSVRVVTTLSSYADIAKTIGGERVEVFSVASPKFNPHFIEPRPSDVLKLKKADLFLHSGLDLEAWRGPLLDAAAKSEFRVGGEKQLDLSEGIPLLEVPNGQVSRAEGDIHQFGNPHYWIDPRNGLIIARHIMEKLCKIDPSGKSIYTENFQQFEQKLQTKINEWQAKIKPVKGSFIIGYHNEWPYLMQFLGLKMEKFIEPKPGIPPGPQHLQGLVEYMHNQRVKAVVQTSYYSPEAGNYLEKQGGIKVISLCQNVQETAECPDYISMIDDAVKQLLGALS